LHALRKSRRNKGNSSSPLPIFEAISLKDKVKHILDPEQSVKTKLKMNERELAGRKELAFLRLGWKELAFTPLLVLTIFPCLL